VVRDALARLGELDREVLSLTVWEELEPREIAEVLGVSAAAVRTRLSRARARLRDLLGDELGAAGHVAQGSTSRPRIALEEGS
jgi:RNA polymerase sigma-70 factor (ECF subfamily)